MVRARFLWLDVHVNIVPVIEERRVSETGLEETKTMRGTAKMPIWPPCTRSICGARCRIWTRTSMAAAAGRFFTGPWGTDLEVMGPVER